MESEVTASFQRLEDTQTIMNVVIEMSIYFHVYFFLLVSPIEGCPGW